MKNSWEKAEIVLKHNGLPRHKAGVIILPTDTIYGIVGDAFSKKAILRMYKIKGRNTKKPFIVLISDLNDLKKFKIDHLPIRTNKRIENLLTKKISILLSCPSKKFSYLHRGTKKIAFRLITKNNKNLFNLIKKVGPIATTSTNPEGLKPAETITEAKKYFGSKIDLYVSGGRKKGTPSTLIEYKNNRIVVLRQGQTIIK
ncbi:MAG: L-threonylcarbamoyladenylate synthase [Candidatus Paceibacterota bacterium]|jgi:L-threonylcarbamoyladenylate synthase